MIPDSPNFERSVKPVVRHVVVVRITDLMDTITKMPRPIRPKGITNLAP